MVTIFLLGMLAPLLLMLEVVAMFILNLQGAYLIERFSLYSVYLNRSFRLQPFSIWKNWGSTTVSRETLPKGSQGILGYVLAHYVPVHEAIAAFMLTGVGSISGLNGSWFSAISLAGSIAALFIGAIGKEIPALTAPGQVAAI